MSYQSNELDERVTGLLKAGAVGLLPSDTIYGLSCAALNETAVQKIHEIKDRDEHKPFIILISKIKMLDMLSINKTQVLAATKYWPGALTLICSAPQAPAWLQLGTKSLAIRIPDNSQLINLINRVGPIVSTSANKQNQQPLNSVEAVKAVFGSKLDFYVDVGPIESQPSTIVKFGNGQFEVLRQGAVTLN